MQDAQTLGFDVSHAVERIGQQSARTGVQRERHGIYREIAAAHVVINGAGSYLGGLAGFVVFFRPGAGYLGANVAVQKQVQGARWFFNGLNDCARLFKILLQLERVPLDGKIKITDDEAAEDVADCSAGKIHIELLGASDLGYLLQCSLLVRRKPGLHKINKVGHSGFILVPPNARITP